MSNSHDEIKNLLKASKNLFSTQNKIKEENDIKSKYGLITEQGVELTDLDVTDKLNVAKSIEDKIDDDVKPKRDKSQAYKISGGILVLHGKEKKDVELTIEEKDAFMQTMTEFNSEVSELVEFDRLNVYTNNVEWSGKLLEQDLEFIFSIGEENGIYIKGDMIRTDDSFLELIENLKSFYEKFKNKWSTILASRKMTTSEF